MRTTESAIRFQNIEQMFLSALVLKRMADLIRNGTIKYDDELVLAIEQMTYNTKHIADLFRERDSK